MFLRANFVNIYLQGMLDRSRRSRTELAREIQLTDWSTAGNLSNRSSGVQIPRDICTRLKRYLYSAKCSWIINLVIMPGAIWRKIKESKESLESNHKFVCVLHFPVLVLHVKPALRRKPITISYFPSFDPI